MKLSDFLLNTKRTILLDGGMGSQLAQRGAEMGGQTNHTHPDIVKAVHQDYAKCGVDIIITNTLTMNRVNIERHKVKADVKEVNEIGVKLARSAAGKDQYVIGDISSTGVLLKPSGALTEEEAYASFLEQAGILAGSGADGFIVETMTDIKEALCALKACKKAAAIPVIVSMSFRSSAKGGRTIMGNTAQDCAKALADAGADIVGTNCGELDPLQMAEIISYMKKTVSVPLIAQPNAGRAKLVNKNAVYDMPPADFARGAVKCIEAGASLVGGCCGTSPAHIQALADLIKK